MDARDYASRLEHRLNMTLTSHDSTSKYMVKEVLRHHKKGCDNCGKNDFEKRGWYVDRDSGREKLCLDCAEGMCPRRGGTQDRGTSSSSMYTKRKYPSSLDNDKVDIPAKKTAKKSSACERCGRTSHPASRCYAKEHVDGLPIDDGSDWDKDVFEDDFECDLCGRNDFKEIGWNFDRDSGSGKLCLVCADVINKTL